jgi:DNA polymerase-3 subunit delta'
MLPPHPFTQGQGTVPGFDTIIGQALPVRLLQTLISKASVPHALLFTGRQGIGKTTTARYFAAALNCANTAGKSSSPDACGRCRSCSQILGNQHPDVILVEPRGAYLRIDQIRNLRHQVAMKAHSARYRAVIIADGHCMNPEAANALLKLLEEPPQGTILIITARQRSELLPTIVSRCQHIRFNPISISDISTLLVEHHGLDSTQAEQIARLSEGSLGQALHLKDRPYRQERDWLISAAGLDHPERLSQRPLSGALAFAAQLAKHKERIDELLETLKTWIRDLSIYPFNPDQVINRDLDPLLRQADRFIRAGQTMQWWRAVDKAQRDIAGNANLRLTLDVMALSMCHEPFTAGDKRPAAVG